MNNLDFIMFENTIDDIMYSDVYMLTVLEEAAKPKTKEETGKTKKKKEKMKKVAKIVLIISIILAIINILSNIIKCDITEEEKQMMQDIIDDCKYTLKEAKEQKKILENSPYTDTKLTLKVFAVSERIINKAIPKIEKFVESGKVPLATKLNLNRVAKKYEAYKQL